MNNQLLVKGEAFSPDTRELFDFDVEVGSDINTKDGLPVMIDQIEKEIESRFKIRRIKILSFELSN